jgi:hypothetical protein
MKTYERVGNTALLFLTSALDEGKWFSFTPQPLYPGGKSFKYHWIRGWEGPRADLDTVK